MKAKQKNLRVFEIEIDKKENFFGYIEKNYILLKDYFLLLRGVVDDDILEFLKNRSMSFYDTNNLPIKKISNIEQSVEDEPKKENLSNFLKKDEIESEKDLVFFRTIRSGETIESKNSITIFGRVNSGSKICSQGNIAIFGEVDGVVESNGDYMIVQKLGSGYLVFKGEIVDNSKIVGEMKKIFCKNREIEIEDL